MATLIVRDPFQQEIEKHSITGCFKTWLKETCPHYTEDRTPFVLFKNGIKTNDFSTPLKESDLLEAIIQPNDPLTIAAVVIAVGAAGYAYYAANNLPDTGYQGATEPGKSVYSANAQANQAQPNGAIREVSGNITIFPDIIAQKRVYENNDEYLYYLLSVGRGYFDLRASNLYISQTPFANYENDIEYEISEPGEDLSSQEYYKVWYESDEVTDLRLITSSTPQYGVWTVDYSGATITSYLDGVATEFPFDVDERFKIEGGTNPGIYQVDSKSGGDNEIATVTEIQRSGGNTGRLEALAQTSRAGPLGSVVRNTFDTVGTPSFSAASGEAVEWDSIAGGVRYEGPFRLTPPGVTSRYAEIDVLFNGLTDLDSNNENTDRTVELELQWRAIGTGTWNTIASTSFTAATYDQLGYTVEVDYGSEIEPEHRYRRVTPDADSNTITDIVEIKRVKSQVYSPNTYPDITTIGMKIRGTNALARTAENKINIRGAKRKLPTLAELEADSFNLSNAVTRVTNPYQLGSTTRLPVIQFTDIGLPLDTTGSVAGMSFSSDGRKLLFYDNGLVKIYNIREAFNINGMFDYNGYVLMTGEPPVAARIVDSKSKVMYIAKQNDPSVFFFIEARAVSIPSDTGEYTETGSTNTIVLGSEIADAVDMEVRTDGDKLWVADGDGQKIEQYSMSTSFDASTVTQDSVSFDFSTDFGDNTSDSTLDLRAVVMAGYSGSLPTRMFALRKDGTIFSYLMSTAGDITTASLQESFDTGVTNPYGIHIETDKLFVSSTETDTGFVTRFDLDLITDNRATRNPIRFAAWVAYDLVGSRAKDLLDWTTLSSLETLLDSREDYLDAEFVDDNSAWEVIKTALAVGFCEPTVKEGLFTSVREAIAETDYSDVTHLYTPDVMLDDGLRINKTLYRDTERDGVVVEYFDEDSNAMEPVNCFLPGDLGLNPERIQVIGPRNRDKAWRIGMRKRRKTRYKPAQYSFTTELDALNSDYGDIIAIASDIFPSQFGEVVSVSGSNVTLNFDVTIGAGTYYAGFRNREGKFSGLYTIVAGSSANVITLTSPTTLDFTPVTEVELEPTLVTIGTAEDWGKRAIVKAINPFQDTVEVIAEEYLDEIYEDDEGTAP